jgi:hypothetical protein
MKFIKTIFLSFLILTQLSACKYYEKVDQRQRPDGAKAKARKNVEEGRGVGLGDLLKRKSGGNFEFSSSNPMWIATLETLDFLPLSTVDYSGGMIISDWYSDSASNSQSLKISVRFLSNEVTANSLKIIVHQKDCSVNKDCQTSVLPNSKIQTELNSVIVKKAALIEKQNKKKK